jgi:hypothetical protein
MTAITQILITFSVVLGRGARPGAARFLASPVRMAFRSGSVNGPDRQFVANAACPGTRFRIVMAL